MALALPVSAAADSAQSSPAVTMMHVDADQDAVPVPETIGAACLAVIGFMFMFRRRRLS